MLSESVAVWASISAAVFGVGGTLVGGFFVYHRVEPLLLELKAERHRQNEEHDKQIEAIEKRIDAEFMPRELCGAEKKACLLQFTIFKEGQAEIKQMFTDLKEDLKTEMKLLRECISAATSGKC